MKRFFNVISIFFLVACLSVPVFASGEPNSDTTFGQGLVSFIKWVFIPPDDYFPKQIADLSVRVNEKLGGVGYLYSLLDNFFKSLNMGNASPTMIFSLSDNYFFEGYKGFSGDILFLAAPYISLLKNVFNLFICIITAIACYHKLRKFFSE